MDFIEIFTTFLKQNFNNQNYKIDYYKSDLIFIDIDCLKDKTKQLVIEIQLASLSLSIMKKNPDLPDFSLPDKVFNDIQLALNRVLEIKKNGEWKKGE